MDDVIAPAWLIGS